MTPEMTEDCDVEELSRRLKAGDDLLLLDVRTGGEVAVAAIPGSTHIPMDQIPARLAELESWRDREIIVQCHHGGRSARVQGFLLQKGFTKVRNLDGGIDAWSERIDPTVTRY